VRVQRPGALRNELYKLRRLTLRT